MAFTVNGCQCRYSGGQSNFGPRNASRRKMTTFNVWGVARSSIFPWPSATNHLLLCSAPNASQTLSRATDSSDSPHYNFVLRFLSCVQGIQATSCRNKSHLNIDVALMIRVNGFCYWCGYKHLFCIILVENFMRYVFNETWLRKFVRQ